MHCHKCGSTLSFAAMAPSGDRVYACGATLINTVSTKLGKRENRSSPCRGGAVVDTSGHGIPCIYYPPGQKE